MAGFEEALRQNQELQDSKYKLLGVTYKDGPEMSRLKNAGKAASELFFRAEAVSGSERL